MAVREGLSLNFTKGHKKRNREKSKKTDKREEEI